MGLESNAIKRPKDAGIDCAEEGFLSRFPSLFFIIEPIPKPSIE
jgi:hypothetical protein